jgi:hypothetical protein
MKKSIRELAALAFVCALLPAARLPAEPPVVLPEGAYILPPDFHPGDVVELRLPVQVSAKGVLKPGKRELRLPGVSEDYDITKILLETGPKGSTMSLFFVAWKAGAIKLAAFESEGARFPGATVVALSILSKDEEKARPPRGPLFLPGTRTFAAVIASCLAALILAAWAMIAFIMPLMNRMLSVRRARKPFRRFQHELRIMRKRLKDEDQAYFYALLSRAFRSYASSRLFPAFASLTAGEFAPANAGEFAPANAGEFAPAKAAMPNDAGLDGLGSDREFVASVLMRADLVRFADSGSGQAERVQDMERLSRIVERLEESRAGV